MIAPNLSLVRGMPKKAICAADLGDHDKAVGDAIEKAHHEYLQFDPMAAID